MSPRCFHGVSSPLLGLPHRRQVDIQDALIPERVHLLLLQPAPRSIRHLQVKVPQDTRKNEAHLRNSKAVFHVSGVPLHGRCKKGQEGHSLLADAVSWANAERLDSIQTVLRVLVLIKPALRLVSERILEVDSAVVRGPLPTGDNSL